MQSLAALPQNLTLLFVVIIIVAAIFRIVDDCMKDDSEARQKRAQELQRESEWLDEKIAALTNIDQKINKSVANDRARKRALRRRP